MSHITGTLQTVAPISIGPDTGAAASSPNTWAKTFHPVPAPPPGGLKFAILHFTGVILPANNRLEVDLGYDTDIFTAADGNDFWTRPVNVTKFAGGDIPIRYITNGAANGIAILTQYGRGERHFGKQDPTSLSNSDPFLIEATYTEPNYDPLWLCNPNTQNWENIQCENNVNDIRRKVAKAVGMVVHIYHDSDLNLDLVSTCTVTLIGADLVITAGHCIVEEIPEVASASVIFNYETDCGGTHPGAYSGMFFKVKKRLKQRWLDAAFPGFDYCLLELKIPPAGINITPIPLRTGIPAAMEQVFGIHHPNGAVKKLAQPHPGFTTVNSSGPGFISVRNLDVSGGSSGSGIFDTMGRICGMLSNGGSCNLNYFPMATAIQDIAATPVPSPGRDIMLVFDRSGSMSLPAGTGKTKMEEAKDAASLFVQLLQTGGGNKIGFVSFSTGASNPVDFGLAALSNNAKDSLVGNAPPYTGGVVGGIVANGSTTIGGGLQAAHGQFGAGNNQRTILLLTDGLQNTPPMINTVNPILSDTEIHVIGFGTESSLDGTLLNQLAQEHRGMYTRAGDPLNLKKFFAIAFGNIFQSGTLADPEYFLAANDDKAKPIIFPVCGEEILTVVLGWDKTGDPLILQVISPGGTVINPGMPGVEGTSGNTWTFIRIHLPYNGQQDGSWQVIVSRAPVLGEFAAPHIGLRYFVNIVVKGGPELRLLNPVKKYFTGDRFNPLVVLATREGSPAANGKVKLTIQRPDDSLGNILSLSRLKPAMALDADMIPARQATLLDLETQSGKPAVGYKEETFNLISNPENAGGYLEPEGIYGLVMKDILRTEGNYQLHALATYGDGCLGSKEFIWSIHVETGIDASKTLVKTEVLGDLPGGKKRIRFTITPMDIYGNKLGPGRSDGFEVTPAAGSDTDGAVKDYGDGTYSVIVGWDPSSGYGAGVVIAQPGRPGVIVAEPGKPSRGGHWKVWFWILLVILILVLLWFLFIA